MKQGLFQLSFLHYLKEMVSRSSKAFSHLNSRGEARMVDVSPKETTERYARAQALLVFPPRILSRVLRGNAPKGDIFGPARIAGILAAKNTAELIPLCHSLPLDHVSVHFRVVSSTQLEIICEARTRARTGVEMEALTGATLAALTVYDMCKALGKSTRIREIRLLEKTGGKSGTFHGI